MFGPPPQPSFHPGATYPVKYRKHHVELLLLLLLSHVAWRVAQFREQASQVHQAQCVVLGAALLLPRPPHDPLHHVHLERLCQGKGSPVEGREVVNMFHSSSIQSVWVLKLSTKVTVFMVLSITSQSTVRLSKVQLLFFFSDLV